MTTAYALLWNLSRHAMVEATQMRDLVQERDHKLALRSARMPEESVTVSLVRRLAVGATRTPGARVGAVLHTRALEGGNNKKQNRSKADLEITIKYGQRTYLNLVLQAKSLRHDTGTYKGWSATDNKTLVQWATQQGQDPGMLLYNEEVPQIVSGASGVYDVFAGCPRATHYSPRFAGGMGGQTPPFDGTPGGISLVLDSKLLTTLDDPTLDQIKTAHVPLEHLMHDAGCTKLWTPPAPTPIQPQPGTPTSGGASGPTPLGPGGPPSSTPDSPSGPDSVYAPTLESPRSRSPMMADGAPGWAQHLLGGADRAHDGEKAETQVKLFPEDYPLAASVVLDVSEVFAHEPQVAERGSPRR